MEEFKIVSIPKSLEEEKEIIKEENDDTVPPKRRFLGIILLIVLVIAACFVIHVVSKYTDYETEKQWERKDSAETKFVDYEHNLLKYSGDGIFYTTYSGSLIWNYTFDMNCPDINIRDKYIIVFDKKGTEIDIFTSEGYVNTIKSNYPIMDAQVGNQGTIALLSRDSGISYIQMYDTNKRLLVSGEVHPENGGFPISIALSSDAKKLMLSSLNLNSGDLNTELIVYDFSKDGKKEEDNITARYTYKNVVIPQVEYLKGDKAVAFGDCRIILFNNNKKSSVIKEIAVKENIITVFYNNKYFGYIVEAPDERGKLQNQLNIYNLFGFRSLNKNFKEYYQEVYLNNNNEIVVQNNNEIYIYNIQGFMKFKYRFSDNIYRVFPGETTHRYYLIKENQTEKIQIK